MQDEQSGTETAHSGAVAVLRAQIDDLEAVMAAQEGELHVLRTEEGRARDACAELQHTCTTLHSQVCLHRRRGALPAHPHRFDMHSRHNLLGTAAEPHRLLEVIAKFSGRGREQM